MESNAMFHARISALACATALSLLIAGCGKDAPSSTAPSNPSIGTQIDDTVVTTQVKSALLGDPGLKSLELKVETRKGVVQLAGYADSADQATQAAAITAGVAGVTGVENNISVKDSKTTIGHRVDDGIITTKVKSALLADPDVKSFDIAVVTRKGEVQLSGFVDNQTQIDQAVAITNKVDGVTGVGNEMSIKK
jgi:hyperosmotically inducible protein